MCVSLCAEQGSGTLKQAKTTLFTAIALFAITLLIILSAGCTSSERKSIADNPYYQLQKETQVAEASIEGTVTGAFFVKRDYGNSEGYRVTIDEARTLDFYSGETWLGSMPKDNYNILVADRNHGSNLTIGKRHRWVIKKYGSLDNYWMLDSVSVID